MAERTHSQRQWTFAAELLLWLCVVVCFSLIGQYAAIYLRSRHEADQLYSAVALAQTTTHEAQAVQEPGDTAHTTAASANGKVVGRLEIRALHLKVPITIGVDPDSLLRGVGLIQGTANPGGLGTMALAGHRDTYLRPLEHVQSGMEVLIATSQGTFHYIIDSSEVVTPEQVEVLAIRSEPELVLITCYPFHFIGAAPKRFIVHAHLVSLIPDPN